MSIFGTPLRILEDETRQHGASGQCRHSDVLNLHITIKVQSVVLDKETKQPSHLFAAHVVLPSRGKLLTGCHRTGQNHMKTQFFGAPWKNLTYLRVVQSSGHSVAFYTMLSTLFVPPGRSLPAMANEYDFDHIHPCNHKAG
jgi:hypothetical protein